MIDVFVVVRGYGALGGNQCKTLQNALIRSGIEMTERVYLFITIDSFTTFSFHTFVELC